MKKEIIINASKDRSRIAIVEDGELAELYVEHPDNVRTLGNIYLARIRRVMPAIRAAFVDVGQKQDAFLHFSDLTDNLGELLAIVGEKVPGYSARKLSQAPQKRIADDENEPDVEDTLELDSGEDDKNKDKRRSSRRSRSNRSRNHNRQHRRRKRKEEEEEQEESDATPFVIDLTFKPGRVTKEEAQDAGAHDGSRHEDVDAHSDSSDSKEEVTEPQDEPTPVEAGIGTIDLTSGGGSSTSDKAQSSNRSARSSQSNEKGTQRDEWANRESGDARDDEGDSASERGRGNERDDSQAEDRRERRRGRRGSRRRRPSKDKTRSHEDNSDQAETTSRDDASNKEQDRKRSSRGQSSNRHSQQGGRQQKSNGQNRDSGKSQKPDSRDKGKSRNQQNKQQGPPSIRPDEMLKQGGSILVKVTKEPISNKGSRVSTDISFAGRFLVLVPAADYVAVSKKIDSARERRRLRNLASSLKPDGFGVIVRTVAAGKDAKTLDTDLSLLIDKWKKIENRLNSNASPPELLYEDVNMVSSIIRDLFTSDFDRVLVDDPKLHRNIRAYVQAVAPQMAERIKLHRSNQPVFRAAGIESAVEQVFSSRVPLPSGGYLFIEHTEAMHVVDVNSGRAGKGKSQSENLLSVNLEAAHEVARQLRLRDLGGIIVVDFIDMYRDSDRRKVYQAMKREFAKDRAVTKLLPMSDFGLIEITRQRLRPSITASGSETSDPTSAMEAAGAAEILQPKRNFGPERLEEPTSPEEVADLIGGWLKSYNKNVKDRYRERPIVLRVHPLLASYLKRGVLNRMLKWRLGIKGIKFSFETNPKLHPLDFDACDKKSGKSLKARFIPKS